MHKVVIDTNVFISGIVFGGNPRKIIMLWVAKKYILCLSPHLKAEILGKLQRKFLLPKQTLRSITEALDRDSQKYIPEITVDLCRDPQDNFLLALAKDAGADFLISGDKDVIAIGNFEQTKILSPVEFLQILA